MTNRSLLGAGVALAVALRAAKHTLDPQGLLNPGVLLDP